MNINLDTGLKALTINGDESKTIWINPSDINLVPRFKAARDSISAYQADAPESDDIDVMADFIAHLDKYIREQIDFIFDAPVSDAVFGGASPLSTVKGVYFFERFLDAIFPVVAKELEAEAKASNKRVAKYTAKYKRA